MNSSNIFAESADWLLNILDNAPTPMMVYADDGEVVRVNKAWSDLSGYLIHDIPTIDIWLNKACIDWDSTASNITSLHTYNAGEINIQTRYGNNRVWELKTDLLERLPDGRQLIVTMASDITDRKRAEIAVEESQAYLAALIESTSDMIWSVDPHNFGLLTYNSAVSKYLSEGYDIRVQLGMTPSDIFPADQAAFWTRMYQRVLDEGHLTLEHTLARTNHHIQLTVNTVVMKGVVVGISVMSKDLSEHQSALEALTNSKEKFYAAFRSNPSGIAIVSLEDARYIDVNEMFEEMSGWSRDELIGKTPYELGIWVDHQQFIEANRIFQETGILRDFEVDVRKKNGELRKWIAYTQMMEIDGEPLFITGALDITERKQAEEALAESESQYRMLFENMVHGVSVRREDETLTDVNDAALKIFGLTRDQFVGRSALDPDWHFIDPDGTKISPDQSPSEIALRTGVPVRDRMVGIYNTTTNDYVWTMCNAVPLFRNGEDKPYQVFSTIVDVTERKQVAEKLRTSEEKFSVAFRSNPAALSIVKVSDLTFIDVNEKYEEITGWRKDELVGRTAFETGIWLDKDQQDLAFKKYDESGALKDFEIDICTKSGEVKKCLISTQMIEMAGEPHLLIGIVDITERVRMETEILERSEELEAHNIRMLAMAEERDRFFRNVSHELRTPLTSVIGFAELLMEDEEEPLSSRQKMQLSRVVSNSNKLLGMVNDILDISRIDAQRMELHIHTIKLDEFIIQTAANLTPLAEEKNLTLHFHLDNSLYICTDENKLGQILINLISNAIKFTTEGRIDIFSSAENEKIKISIKDTGIGIPELEIAHIFKEFHRAHEQASSIRGTGLGLTLAKRMIKLLGGEISVVSEVGKGSTFTVSLPESLIGCLN